MPSRTPKPTPPAAAAAAATATAAVDSSAPPQDPSHRPLNVSDALSYLDAVKIQFRDHPDVYNTFLDIMKDFKSEVIDTPGVIDRVSKLFHGSPELIQGFNTFLPPGYRIDISSDLRDPAIITVTTPMGTTSQPTHPFDPFPPPLPPYHKQQPLDALVPAFQGPSTTAAASFLGALNNKVENRPAGEFNHAIQYLNKIKARYSNDSDVYKHFLEILQTYQREQRQIHDSQVYAQVQSLFKDAPDLLAEFKDFLPEVHVPFSAQAVSDKNSRRPSAAPVPVTKKKRRAPESEPTPVPPSRSAVSRAKKGKHVHRPGESDSPHFVQYGLPTASPPHPVPPQVHSMSQAVLPHMSLMVAPSSATDEQLLFFERTKRALESKDTYDEFLRLLSLYSKDIVDTKMLVELSQVFLGDGDLFAQFKDVVGYDDRKDSVECGPPGSIRTGPPEPVSALPADEGEGPSYRRLPDSEIRLACSGRDQLCRSVLNDVWVSHPTWASEEAGFISHKKNSFEEALHKSEEERHEYQVQLEGLSRTIAILEPLHVRLEEMTSEERAGFRLKADFGGPSKSIYHRTVNKVYGRDAGAEVIQALQECPSVAVPVVLARLKAKDEEWRRVQREWNKTWREVDAKNFYKSLDHQGNVFKANDKRCITAKHFVGNVETIKTNQVRRREKERRRAESWSVGWSVGSQLEFEFGNTEVLQDVLRLVYSFLDHSQAQYSVQERRQIVGFLRSFVPLLCILPVGDFDASCGLVGEDEREEVVVMAAMPRSGTRSAGGGTRQGSPVIAGDLRRRLLKAAKEKANANAREAASPRSVPGPAESGLFENDAWIRTGPMTGHRPSALVKRKYFFCNSTFYTMLCLFQLIYHRIVACKEAARQTAETLNPADCNPIAVELGLDDSTGPAAVLAQAMEALGERRPDEAADVVYLYFLDACEKLFENELEPGLFEEHMRWFFGNKAFYLFTLDKLIAAFVKQVQSVVSDNKCQELWTLLQEVRRVDTLTNQDMIRYRRESERHVGSDEHLYRIEWDGPSRKMTIYLLDGDDRSVEGDQSSMTRWREYVDSYVLRQPTEWVPSRSTDRSGPSFLRRYISTDETPPRVQPEWEGMQIRISLGTYKLFYEAGAEDALVCVRGEEEERELRERARVRNEERRRNRWLLG